jgi:hypothetical protein
MAVRPSNGTDVMGKYDMSLNGAPFPPVHLVKSKQHDVPVLIRGKLGALLSHHFGCITQLYPSSEAVLANWN